jgi:hypothetical protein
MESRLGSPSLLSHRTAPSSDTAGEEPPSRHGLTCAFRIEYWLGQIHYAALTAIKRESIARLRTQQASRLSALTQSVNENRWYWTEHAVRRLNDRRASLQCAEGLIHCEYVGNPLRLFSLTGPLTVSEMDFSKFRSDQRRPWVVDSAAWFIFENVNWPVLRALCGSLKEGIATRIQIRSAAETLREAI